MLQHGDDYSGETAGSNPKPCVKSRRSSVPSRGDACHGSNRPTQSERVDMLPINSTTTNISSPTACKERPPERPGVAADTLEFCSTLDCVRVSIHASAFKHGNFTRRQIADAWTSGEDRRCWLDGAEPSRQLRIGFTADGVELELVGLVFDESRVLIIHVMLARPASRRTIERVQRRRS